MLVGTGCATLFSRAHYDMRFESHPSGAKVLIEDRQGRFVTQGMTPFSATLSARRGYLRPAVYRVRIDHAGHWPEVRNVYADLDPWVIGDLLLPGSVVWLFGVDGVSGAMWRLPKQTLVELTPMPP